MMRRLPRDEGISSPIATWASPKRQTVGCGCKSPLSKMVTFGQPDGTFTFVRDCGLWSVPVGVTSNLRMAPLPVYFLVILGSFLAVTCTTNSELLQTLNQWRSVFQRN